jgi:hypothetical protein
VLELLLHCLPLLVLVAGQACELVNGVVDASKLHETMTHGFKSCRRRGDGRLQDLQLFLNSSLVGTRT